MRTLAVVLALALAAVAAPLGAASVRTIATIVLDTWFDGGFRTKVEDVTLVGILPKLTLEARVSREDTAGWHGWQVGLGPVVNLTPNLYLVALYNSRRRFRRGVQPRARREPQPRDRGHRGLPRAESGLVPVDRILVLHAVPGREVPPRRRPGPVRQGLHRRGRRGGVSGSFWGEADWRVTPAITVRAGGPWATAAGSAGRRSRASTSPSPRACC